MRDGNIMMGENRPALGPMEVPARFRPGAAAMDRGMIYAMVFGFLVLAVIAIEWFRNVAGYSAATKGLASLIMILGVLPGLRYLLNGNFKVIPFFEGHCAFYALTLGFAGFRPILGTSDLSSVTEPFLFKGMQAALICLMMLFLGFYAVGWFLFRNARPFTLNVPDSTQTTPKYLIGGFVATFLLALIGSSAGGGFVQMRVGVWLFTIILFGTCVFAKLVSTPIRVLYWVLFIPWMVIVGSGLLHQGQAGIMIQFSLWQVISYFWARERAFISWIVLSMVLVLLLQPIKDIYRGFVWGGYVTSTSDQLNMLSGMLLEQGYVYKAKNVDSHLSLEVSLARMNHLIVTAGVIRDTPDKIPFRKGATYYPLFVKWIPRMLWPDKPIEDLGNRWAREYGYLAQTDFTTSFNLPWITEMYINFGWYGVVFIPFILGVLFRGLWEKLAKAPRTVLDFCLGMTVLSPLIVVESHLSMMLGGVIVHSIGVILVLVAIRAILRLLNITPRPALRPGRR